MRAVIVELKGCVEGSIVVARDRLVAACPLAGSRASSRAAAPSLPQERMVRANPPKALGDPITARGLICIRCALARAAVQRARPIRVGEQLGPSARLLLCSERARG